MSPFDFWPQFLLGYLASTCNEVGPLILLSSTFSHVESCGYTNWKGIDRCTDDRSPTFFWLPALFLHLSEVPFLWLPLYHPTQFETSKLPPKKLLSPENKETWKSNIKRPRTRQMISEASYHFGVFFANSSGSLNSLKVAPETNGPILTLPSYQVMPIFFESASAPFCHCDLQKLCEIQTCCLCATFLKNHSVSATRTCCRVANVTGWEWDLTAKLKKVYTSYIAVLYICPTSNSRLCR